MKILRVTSKVDGFRRADMAHPAVATDHPIDSLSKEQIEALKGEPMLVVEEAEVEDPEPKEAEKPTRRPGKAQA
jgi:hypothetical protein